MILTSIIKQNWRQKSICKQAQNIQKIILQTENQSKGTKLLKTFQQAQKQSRAGFLNFGLQPKIKRGGSNSGT